MSEGTIKCVVWDLDDTLWDGILLEDEEVEVRPEAVAALKTLDERGILHAIASRNEFGPVQARLREAGLEEYFLQTRIHWGVKSESIREIAAALGLGLDTFAFIDDQEYEREEVKSALPDVMTIDAADVAGVPDLPRMAPESITADARGRRTMYRAEMARQDEEKEFAGPREDFLRTLSLRLSIFVPGPEDLERASELTLRTNQLNATGLTYSEKDLARFVASDRHLVLMASLSDRFGDYGRIGLAILDLRSDVWTIRLLLMSCRVISRGVGTILINHLLERARDAGVRLRARFVPTDRNRMLYATYKFAGFAEVEEDDLEVLLENDFSRIQPCPDYVTLEVLGP